MLKFLKFDLFLHDGEGAGTGEGAEGTTDTAAAEPQETPEDRAKAYSELKMKYKDEFNADLQKIIDKRFAKAKQAEERLSKQDNLIGLLHQRYGTKSIEALSEQIENDESYLEKRAYELGLTPEQVIKHDRMERENAQYHQMLEQAERDRQANEQVQKWFAEAEAVKEKFPDFDLDTELQSEGFAAQLKAGVPMELAFKTAHFDDLMQSTTAYTAQQTAKAVTDNIRARGTRPVENGAAGKNGFTSSIDVSKFTAKDFEEYGRRAARGEKITFR